MELLEVVKELLQLVKDRIFNAASCFNYSWNAKILPNWTYNYSQNSWDWSLVLMWNNALRQNLISVFKSFLLVLAKNSFWQDEWELCYHSIKFIQTWIFPNFLKSSVLSRSTTRLATLVYHVYHSYK